MALNGDGADESVGGYDWYKMDCLFNLSNVIPSNLRTQLSKLALVQSLPLNLRDGAVAKKVGRLADLMTIPAARRYVQWIEHFGPQDRRYLYNATFAESIPIGDLDKWFASVFSRFDADSWLDVLLGTDINLYLADDLLAKMDGATMASSLEARSPFLDHELLEFAASLPTEFTCLEGDVPRLCFRRTAG